MPVYIPELPGLHDNQKDVARSESRWKILCAGRRFGKTRLGIHMLSLIHISEPTRPY